MIIPIRCFSCGKVVGDKWEPYLTYLEEDLTEAYVSLVDVLRRGYWRRLHYLKELSHSAYFMIFNRITTNFFI